MESVKIGKEKKKLFRWPEWATLSATCFDKNSLPRRVLNFNLSYHCNSHAVAVTKLRGVYYPLPSSLHCSDHAGATTAPRGEFLTKLHIPHWAPPEHFCFMTLRLKRPIKEYLSQILCAPSSGYNEPDSPWGLLRLVTSGMVTEHAKWEEHFCSNILNKLINN